MRVYIRTSHYYRYYAFTNKCEDYYCLQLDIENGMVDVY